MPVNLKGVRLLLALQCEPDEHAVLHLHEFIDKLKDSAPSDVIMVTFVSDSVV